MRKILLLILILITSFVKSQIAPNWYSVNPFPQENIQSIKFLNPATGYAAGDNGLLIKTTNAGKPWLSLNSGTNLNLYTLHFFDLNTGLVAGDNGIILRTTNGGTNWLSIASGTTSRITELFFLNQFIGFASAYSGVFLKTTNGGLSWTSASISSNNLRAIYFLDQNTGFCAGDSGVVLKTTNSGLTWILLSYIQYFQSVHSIFFVNSSTGIAATSGSVSSSTNGGLNWISVVSGWPGGSGNNGDIKFINSTTGFNINGGGPLLKTTNSGLNWSITGPVNVMSITGNSISIPDTLNFIISSGRGAIYKTRTDSLGYYRDIGGYGGQINYACFPNAAIGFMHNYGTIIMTIDGGLNWSISNTGQNNWFEPSYTWFEKTVHNGNGILYRKYRTGGGGGGYFQEGVTRSTNYGLTWDAPGSFGSLLTIVNDVQAKGNNAFITTLQPDGYKFWVSENGASWLNRFQVSGVSLSVIAFANETTGIVRAVRSGNNYAFLIRTTNTGSTWDSVPYPVPNLYPYSFVLCPGGSGYIVYDSGKVYKTTNFGINWFMSFNNPSFRFRTIQFLNDNTGYGLNNTNKLLYTSNGGFNWSMHETGTTKQLVTVNFVDFNNGYLTGDSGVVLKTTNGGLTFYNPVTQNVPYKFYLYQNYPNPFNPTTKIRFDIPAFPPLPSGKGQGVRLIVFNSLGQLIKTLINHPLSPGTYETEFDGSNYSSGIYFYTISISNETDNFIQSKKMLLIK